MKGAESRIIVNQMRNLEPIMTYIHITSFVHAQNSQMGAGGTDLTEPHRTRFVDDKPGSRAAGETPRSETQRRQQETVRNRLGVRKYPRTRWRFRGTERRNCREEQTSLWGTREYTPMLQSGQS